MNPRLLIALFSAVALAAGETAVNSTAYNFPSTEQHQQETSPAVLSQLNSTLCHSIRHVPRDDQCQFALSHCDDYKIGFVNYVSFYYCQRSRLLTLILYSLVLVCLFVTLGITASEFLCPNLDTISKFFKMSESLAGVTLLALGNGSPDVFSTLEAMKIDSADLAIGELVGAALFITAVVVGSMAIVRPFKVVKRPFVRDVLFLLVSITITTVFLSDGEISILEAIIMILLYCCYVVFVVSWDWIITKNRRIKLLDQKVRNHFVDESSRYDLADYQVEESNEINDEDILEGLGPSSASAGIEVLDQQLTHEAESSFDEWTRRSTIQKIRPSILGALDMNNRVADFNDAPSNMSGISLSTLPGRPSTMDTIKKPIAPSIQLSSAPNFRDDEEMSYNEYEARTSLSAPASYDFDRYHDDPASMLEMHGEHMPDIFEAHVTLKNFLEQNNFLQNTGSLFFNFFPTLRDIQSKPISEKIISIICLPSVTMLRLTIPVVSTENKQIDNSTVFGKKFILLLVQCLVSPFITSILMFYEDVVTWTMIVAPLLISAIFITLSFIFRVYYKRGNEQMSSFFTCLLSCCGFIISINWISTIATELISIIKFFAVYFDLSDAILGVTVFAIGNSLGDFISNFTIAKMGFPTMALSACFGGPLLNILLGIGGGALYVIPTTGLNIQVNISKTLIVSGVTLYINLLALLIVVPVNGWYMNKSIGMFMIGLWCSATVICVLLELLG